MSGICGIVGFEDKNLLKRMCDVLRRGGEDDFKIFLERDVSLGSSPLNFTDIKRDTQLIHNEDNSIMVVFDGEIYNSTELKDNLEKVGHKFYTLTDSEVLVHLYEEFGDFFAKKLNGVFCCGIWDNNEKKLLLARDQLGIKSLHYTIVDGSLLFASEIKSILQYDKIKREMDIQSLHYLLGLEFIPGDGTLFKGIKKLPPGYVLIYKGGNIHFHKYWGLTINIFPQKSEEYYINCLLELLKTSVNRRLQKQTSDVSLGSFLSGGMDTSTLVAMMRNLTDRPIKTFNILFGEPVDEIGQPLARMVADQFDTDHYEIIVEPSNFEKILPKVIQAMDEPHLNVGMYMAREFVSKHINVIFDGRGGDELFAGQPRHKYFHVLNPFYRFFPKSISTICTAIISKPIEFQSRYKPEWDMYRRYLWFISSLGNKEKFYLSIIPTYIGDDTKNLYSKELLNKILKPVEGVIKPYFKDNVDYLNQALLTEIKTKLPEEYLVVGNRLSLVNSVAEEVPLVDINLVNFSFTIPPRLKIRGNNSKYIFRKAMARLLPKEVIERRKGVDYGLNPYTLFKEGLREYALQVLPDSNIVKKGYFKQDYINYILYRPPDPRMVRHYRLILILLSLEIWNNMYIDNDNMYKLGSIYQNSL